MVTVLSRYLIFYSHFLISHLTLETYKEALFTIPLFQTVQWSVKRVFRVQFVFLRPETPVTCFARELRNNFCLSNSEMAMKISSIESSCYNLLQIMHNRATVSS